MLNALLVVILYLMTILPAWAQTLDIMTEEDPPYSFIQADGTITGAGVEIVREVQRRIANKDPIKVVPWARAYYSIQKRPNVVVFTMSRTKARDPLFYWVGPIIENNWVIVSKKTSGLQLKSLEDAMTLKSIGVVRGYAWTDYLKQRKFTNLHVAGMHSSNIKMLNSGRIQAIVSTDLTYKSVIAADNLNPDDFEVLLTFKNVKMYIAHSRSTSEAIVKSWQDGFQSMKDDGTLRRILHAWLPTAVVPEYAEASD